MTKKDKGSAEAKPTRKKKPAGVVTTLVDKGAGAMKKAMTPPPMMPAGDGATIIPINGGGPAVAAQAAPAAVALTEVTKRWADAKRMEAQGKREAEAQRKVISKHFDDDPDKLIGYTDPNLEIKKSDDVDWSDPRLHTFLKEKGWFDALCKDPALDPDKVKSKALTEPELQAMLKQVTEKKPKFFQVKDAAEDKS